MLTSATGGRCKIVSMPEALRRAPVAAEISTTFCERCRSREMTPACPEERLTQLLGSRVVLEPQVEESFWDKWWLRRLVTSFSLASSEDVMIFYAEINGRISLHFFFSRRTASRH